MQYVFDTAVATHSTHSDAQKKTKQNTALSKDNELNVNQRRYP